LRCVVSMSSLIALMVEVAIISETSRLHGEAS
jgi:hypothetical protein